MARRQHRARAAHSSRNHGLRVIGGEWRSRIVPIADRPGLRPTPNRVRETLFNWLAPRLEGATCLDLFAGTGALGIEALSRGAASAVFIERDRIAAGAIESALNRLGAAGRGQVIIGDATHAARLIDRPPDGIARDLVFIDPPFAAELQGAALDGVRELLGNQSRLYLEYPAASNAEITRALGDDYEILRQSRSAGVGYCLARIRLPGEHDAL